MLAQGLHLTGAELNPQEEAMTKPVQIETVLKDRKTKFVNFRWLLFIWLGAVAALKVGTPADLSASAYLLLGLFLASQMALNTLPSRYFDGMKILNAIFLLDMNFVLAGFWAFNMLQGELLIMLFLGTFMAALSKNLLQSVATTAVIIGVYLGFKMRTPEGFDFSQPGQLLQLPFLFITSMHSTLLAQEAASDVSARQVLQADKSRLSRHMNDTFSEIAHYCKDMSALVDALPFGAIMLDADAKMRVCNDIAEEVLGIDSANLLAGTLDGHARLKLLKPYLEKAAAEPLADFMEVEFPGEGSGSWSLNLGVYPVREGEINRGLLIVLIPRGYGDAIKEAMPKPLVMPMEAEPVLRAMTPGKLPPLPVLAGMSLSELGMAFG
jgi:PAS domain-containing protein